MPARLNVTIFRVPGHPFTTLFFICACCAVVVSTVFRYPHNSLIGLGIMLSGLPVYLFWRTQKTMGRSTPNAQRPTLNGQ